MRRVVSNHRVSPASAVARRGCAGSSRYATPGAFGSGAEFAPGGGHVGNVKRSTLLTKPIPEPSAVKKRHDEAGGEADWTEPTLADIDRSIPQIDVRFLADIINLRTRVREGFLDEQEAPADDPSTPSEFEGSILNRAVNEAQASANPDSSFKKAPTEHAADAAAREITSQFSAPIEDSVTTMGSSARFRPEYDDGFVIIDVRTVDEVTSWGMVEGAKLLPAHDLYEAFHMGPDEFFDNFGFHKPQFEDKIIFYCFYGPRALMSAQIASWMGYDHVMCLKDGYYEWAKQYNLLIRRWWDHDRETKNNDRRLATFQLAKELARDVAPEFNNLIEEEARRYRLDPNRTRGALMVGGSTLESAKRQLESNEQRFLEGGPMALCASSNSDAKPAVEGKPSPQLEDGDQPKNSSQ